MKFRLFLIITIISFKTFGQTKISKQEALEDIEYLEKTSYDIHPNLYFHKDSIQFNKEIRNFSTLNDSISLQDFQLHLRKNINNLKDGHTFVYLKQYHKITNGNIKYPIKILNKNLFIVKSKNTYQIVSINNIPSSQIYNDLLSIVSGEYTNYKECILEQNFLYFFQMYYGGVTSLEIHSNNEKEKYEIKEYTNKNKEKYSFSHLNDTISILKLSSFSLSDNEGKNYMKFIDKAFLKIKENPNISHLIIDISENSGGNSYYGDYLLSYLTDKPYNAYEYQKLKRSKTSKKYFKKKFIKWYLYPIVIFSKKARLVALKKIGIEKLSIKQIKPIKRNFIFKGEISLIISPKTYSAGATFISSFKNAKIGKVVGQASGQPINGFIDLIPYNLPNSKIKIATSFKEYKYYSNKVSNIIEPDTYIENINKLDYNEILKSISKLKK